MGITTSLSRSRTVNATGIDVRHLLPVDSERVIVMMIKTVAQDLSAVRI